MQKLKTYLKPYKNIVWYPSAEQDFMAMICLSFNSMIEFGISKNEMPDCFIFTDYEDFSEYNYNNKFFLDIDKNENAVMIEKRYRNYEVTALNIKELEKIKLGFNPDMVGFDKKSRYYGKVYAADILIEHPNYGTIISKLIYVIAENTSFAFEYLLKNKIKVKYVIHSNYGYGFGGGKSVGTFLNHILKDLKTDYYVSDTKEIFKEKDVADIYLTDKQKETIPILEKTIDFEKRFNWCGYDETILYKIIGYEYENKDPSKISKIINN